MKKRNASLLLWEVSVCGESVLGRDKDGLRGEISGDQTRFSGSRKDRGIPLIMVPVFKSLLAPSRNLKVTVPGVVGVHSSVVGLPAVRENPEGILNALSPVDSWASTVDNRTATSGRMDSCIIAFGYVRVAASGGKRTGLDL